MGTHFCKHFSIYKLIQETTATPPFHTHILLKSLFCLENQLEVTTVIKANHQVASLSLMSKLKSPECQFAFDPHNTLVLTPGKSLVLTDELNVKRKRVVDGFLRLVVS